MKLIGQICKFASIFKQAVKDLEAAPAREVAYNAAARHYFSLIDWLDLYDSPENLRKEAAPEVYKETLSYYQAVLSALCARVILMAHCPRSRKLRPVTAEDIQNITNQGKLLWELAKSTNNAKELLYILDEAIELSKITDAFRLIKPSSVSAKAFPIIIKNTKEGLSSLAKYEANKNDIDSLLDAVVSSNQIDQASHSAGYALAGGGVGSFADYLYRGVPMEKLLKMFDFKTQPNVAQTAKLTKSMLSHGPLGEIAKDPLSEYMRSNAREASQQTEYPTYEKYVREFGTPETHYRTKQLKELEEKGHIPKTVWHQEDKSREGEDQEEE